MSYGEITEPNPHNPESMSAMWQVEISVPRLTLVQGGGEWSALYQHVMEDGHWTTKLVASGDHYHAEEKIHELCRVHVIQNEDSDFVYRKFDPSWGRNGAERDYVYETLAEVVAAAQVRLDAAAQADALEAQAAALIEQAKELRGS